MGKSKKWDGYSSWDFLKPGIDYRPYAIEPQLNRFAEFPPYDFGLSKTQEEHVQELMERNVAISLHDHLNVFPLEGPRERRRLYKAFQGLRLQVWMSSLRGAHRTLVLSTLIPS